MTKPREKVTRLPVARNGGPHIALLMLKFFNKPTSLEKLTEMSPIKLAVKNRKLFADKLVDLGYAKRADKNGVPMYVITDAGNDYLYEIASRYSKR